MDRNEKFYKFEVIDSHFDKIQSFGTKLFKSSNQISIDFFPPVVEPINFTLKNRALKIIGDQMGTTPVYFQVLEDKVVCSSHISKLSKNAGHGLCFEPISEFADSGVIVGDQTIWEGIFKVNPNYNYTIDFQTKPFRIVRQLKTTLHSKKNSDLNSLLNQLKTSLQKVIKVSENGLFALSGGADTRLLLALMDEEDRKNLTFYTKAHPNIGGARDKDVEIAKSLAKSFGLKHKIVDNPEIYLAFLIPEFATGKPISGLYGGEILGLLKPSSVGVQFKRDQSSKEWLMTLLNTSRSMVYDQLDYGWATPHSLLYFTNTPFIDPEFIDSVFNIDEFEVQEYKIYSKLWNQELLCQYVKTPFSSPITNISPHLLSIEGPEPKLIPSPYQLKTNVKSQYNKELLNLANKIPRLSHQKLKNLQFYVTQTATEDPYGLI